MTGIRSRQEDAIFTDKKKSTEFKRFRNAIFVIAEENNCPLYNSGEEIEVSDGALKLPAGKATCLILAEDVIGMTTDDIAYESVHLNPREKKKFGCSGCIGTIKFEYKKERDFTTLQMKMLAEAERKEKIRQVAKYTDSLKSNNLFGTLKDDEILDIAILLEYEDFIGGDTIARKGFPGNKLFIIIKGKVEVLNDEETVLGEMGKNEVFGEMSLLSGGNLSTTIRAIEPCTIGTMSQKNFRHTLNRHPELQTLFYRLLVSRITTVNQQRTDELASGMVGQIADISMVEICQMLNANQKTGCLRLESPYFNGGLILMREKLSRQISDRKKDRKPFSEIVGLTQGRFKFVQQSDPPEERLEPIGGFMAMLMEGMRRLDDLEE